MIEYRLAGQRFRTRAEGRTTWHSFSFGAHYDPRNVGFAGLVAHNDEWLPAGTGYADHPHAEVEIVSWVLSGALRHTSSVGSGVLGPGSVQRLSAGTGVVHSEVADGFEETRFVQAWLRPDEPDLTPRYDPAVASRHPGWTCLASGDGDGAVPLARRGAALHVTDLVPDQVVGLPEASKLHVFVASGRVLLGERTLGPGDAARLLGEGGRRVRGEVAAHLVVWAFRDLAP